MLWLGGVLVGWLPARGYVLFVSSSGFPPSFPRPLLGARKDGIKDGMNWDRSLRPIVWSASQCATEMIKKKENIIHIPPVEYIFCDKTEPAEEDRWGHARSGFVRLYSNQPAFVYKSCLHFSGNQSFPHVEHST